MKPAKKTLALLLALVLVFALAACSQKADEPQESAPAGDESAQKEAAVFEKDGYKLTVPAEYADLVVVDTEAEDLLNCPGFGKKTLEKFAEYLIFTDPAAEQTAASQQEQTANE